MFSPSNWLARCKKIVAIGRNYEEHAKELGNNVPSSPMFFLKPSTSIITQGQCIQYPMQTSNLHYEVELGVVVGKTGVDVAEKDADQYIAGC